MTRRHHCPAAIAGTNFAPNAISTRPSTSIMALSAPWFMLTTTVAAKSPKIDQQDDKRGESRVRNESGDQIRGFSALQVASFRASLHSKDTPGRLR